MWLECRVTFLSQSLAGFNFFSWGNFIATSCRFAACTFPFEAGPAFANSCWKELRITRSERYFHQSVILLWLLHSYIIAILRLALSIVECQFVRSFDLAKGELRTNSWYFNGSGIDRTNDSAVFDKRNNLTLCGIPLFYIPLLLLGIDSIYSTHRRGLGTLHLVASKLSISESRSCARWLDLGIIKGLHDIISSTDKIFGRINHARSCWWCRWIHFHGWGTQVGDLKGKLLILIENCESLPISQHPSTLVL